MVILPEMRSINYTKRRPPRKFAPLIVIRQVNGSMTFTTCQGGGAAMPAGLAATPGQTAGAPESVRRRSEWKCFYGLTPAPLRFELLSGEFLSVWRSVPSPFPESSTKLSHRR